MLHFNEIAVLFGRGAESLMITVIVSLRQVNGILGIEVENDPLSQWGILACLGNDIRWV
jgi:hypothetical protein